MKTLKYLFACVLVLSIAMFAMPASAENPFIEAFDDAIQQFGKGYIVRPTGVEIGEAIDYGGEIVYVTPDTKNLEQAIEMLKAEQLLGGSADTIKLVGGDYYISKPIVSRIKSINIMGAGMDVTTIHSRGADIDDQGNHVNFPLVTYQEIEANNLEGIRGPVVFRFNPLEDSAEYPKMSVVIEKLTIKTEGLAETWYRICDVACDPPPGTPPIYIPYNSHMGVIMITGDFEPHDQYAAKVRDREQGINVGRIDAKLKQVKIQGDGANTPRLGVFVVPGGALDLLDTPAPGENDGLDFQIHAAQPTNGVVEFEGCIFEHIKSFPIGMMGISSYPLGDIALEDLGIPEPIPISWAYPPETDQTPGIVKITGCTFNDTGNMPCVYSGMLSNLVIWDLSGVDLSITNNSFLNTTGMAAVIAGGLAPVGGGGDIPQTYLPLPLPSRCNINNNQMQLISAIPMFGVEYDGIAFMDLGFLATEGLVKTLDVNISGNNITFNRENVPNLEIFPTAIFGMGLCEALIENNNIEGDGFAAIALGLGDPTDPLTYNPAVECSLLKNKVDNFDAHIPLPTDPPEELDAPIFLGPWSSNCTVIGWGIDPPENILDWGTDNVLVDVQTSTGLGAYIKKIKSPKF